MFEKLRPYPYKYKIAAIIYLLLGLQVVFSLYIGISSFFSTTYIYSFVALCVYVVCKKLRVRGEVQLLLFSIILALFAGEFFLRFINKYPITYSEQGGDGYCSLYKSTRQNYLYMKLLGGRHDIHTQEFNAGEIRDNQCGDYQYPNDTCNALGLRGKLPGKNKKIIAVLGDSFTEGAGAPADSTIPFLIGQHITASDTNTAVLNAGIAGNDPFFDWQMAQKLVPAYSIKQLVLITNTTDITDVLIRGGNERFCSDGGLRYNAAPWWEPLYAISFVFRLFTHNALKRDYLFLTEAEEKTGRQRAIHQIHDLIKDQVAPWAKSRDIDLLVVLIPLEGDTQPQNQAYTDLAASLKSLAGVKVLDCLPAVMASKNIPALYWPNDRHFKPAGYNVISQYVIHNCYQTDSVGTAGAGVK